MRCLIEMFYRSILDETPPPIPYREILLTAGIMDEIFRQVGVGRVGAPDLSGEPLHAAVWAGKR